MDSIADWLVQNGEPEDDVLHRPLFDVNIRLYRGNQRYRELIQGIVTYMKEVMSRKYKDYEELKGLSGANAGIPYNIVLVNHRGKVRVLLNPKILDASDDTAIASSNCGSLRLKQSISVARRLTIDIEFHDEDGKKWIMKKITRFQGGFTLQHEIEHNFGILITDHGKRVE